MARSFEYEEKYYELVRENTSLQKLIQDQNIRIYDLSVTVRNHESKISDLERFMKQMHDDIKILKAEREENRKRIAELERKLVTN